MGYVSGRISLIKISVKDHPYGFWDHYRNWIFKQDPNSVISKWRIVEL